MLKKDGQYKENISDLSGISKKHPLLAISLLIILFSLAGVPPLGGFFAKFYVFVAVIRERNVRVSNYWFINNCNVSILLS